MVDFATPNLPSRNFDDTESFYSRLGFETDWKDAGWMILRRGDLTLEFFPFPDLDPTQSSFSCCLRMDDLDAMVSAIRAADIPVDCTGAPRLHLPRLEHSGLTIAYLVDPDGTLLRLIQNPS